MRHTLVLATLVTLAPAATPALVHAQQPGRVTKEPATPARRPTPRPSAGAGAGAGAAAATTPARPPAAAATRLLADADIAYAKQAAGTGGLKEAMLATLAPDAVLFHPRAVRGRAWAAATTFPAGQYTWAPGWAAVSADATLGVTTGPIAYQGTPPDSSATGQYVTVWSRAAATAPWQVLVQLTVPGPQAPEVTFMPHEPAGDGRPRGGPGAVEASRATLFIADRGLIAAGRTDGQATAVARVAAPDIRVLRAGAFPFVGLDSVRTILAARDADAKYASQIADLRMARSGDFGVAHGIYERTDATGGVTESGNYVRVWERQPDGGWRILLDASAPFGVR